MIKFIFATITIFCITIIFHGPVLASDYPQTALEREIEEMGSLAGGEGLVFKPRKVKSTSTKATIGKINKYLLQASIEVLKFAPLASVDSKSGTLITDWYSPKGRENTQFKLTVYIKDDVITPECLEVIAFEREKTKGGWSDNIQSSAISSVFENKILTKARELYLQSSNR